MSSLVSPSKRTGACEPTRPSATTTKDLLSVKPSGRSTPNPAAGVLKMPPIRTGASHSPHCSNFRSSVRNRSVQEPEEQSNIGELLRRQGAINPVLWVGGLRLRQRVTRQV